MINKEFASVAKKDRTAIVLATCPDCGGPAPEVLRRQRIQHRWIEGVEATREYVAAVDAICCSSCGCQVLDSYAQEQKHEVWCRENRFLTPRQIRTRRKQLQLSIERFAALLAVGKASVSRWERGWTVQSRAYDRLIRLLDEDGVKERLADWSGITLREPERASELRLVSESGVRVAWRFQHSEFYKPTVAALEAQDRFELRVARRA
jgi:putative zinc finger/helix-turn-helix YgiT family protein